LKVGQVSGCKIAQPRLRIYYSQQAIGLGAVWLGVYPNDSLVRGVKTLLKIPEKIIPLCIISVGNPLEEKPPHHLSMGEKKKAAKNSLIVG
jgi:nitroreductase